MKANEAPERIYLVIDPVWGSMSVNYNRNDANNIEYTRTDAFIEKVYDWLKNYAFVDDEQKVHLPTLLHDFIKDSRTF